MYQIDSCNCPETAWTRYFDTTSRISQLGKDVRRTGQPACRRCVGSTWQWLAGPRKILLSPFCCNRRQATELHAALLFSQIRSNARHPPRRYTSRLRFAASARLSSSWRRQLHCSTSLLLSRKKLRFQRVLPGRLSIELRNSPGEEKARHVGQFLAHTEWVLRLPPRGSLSTELTRAF